MVRRILALLAALLVCTGAQATVQTIDGVPLAQNSRVVHYPGIGKSSVVAGTCDGYHIVRVVIRTVEYTPVFTDDQVNCDAAGRFTLPLTNAGGFQATLNGEYPARMYVVYCAATGTLCQASETAAPRETYTISFRRLDFAANATFGGTSADRTVALYGATGSELPAQPGATGIFVAALYEGSIYMLYAGQQTDCATTPRLTWSDGRCYQLVIRPFDASSFIPMVYWPAGGQGSFNAVLHLGPLQLHNIPFAFGITKSLTEMLDNQQWNFVGTMP